MEERIRVVVAGPGPADEGRVAEILARTLRDAGAEVVYTDRPQTPEQLLATVVQEDADAVGIVLAGSDRAPLEQVTRLMGERGIDDVLVFAGDDAAPDEVVDWLRERLRG